MWHKEAITEGELDALQESARRAWADDTRLQRWAGSSMGNGQCYVIARWLMSRLGGVVVQRNGHYAWSSFGGQHLIDLSTCGERLGRYREVDPTEWTPVDPVASERTERFAMRADRIFDDLGELLKLSLDYAGDAYPGEEPERSTLNDQDSPGLHDEPDYEPGSSVYKFVYANGQLEISPTHDHTELAGHAGVPPNHTGPVAVGYVSLNQGRATWEVQSNVNLKSLETVFKDYGKTTGWEWGGLTDVSGQPVSDDFAPKRSETLPWIWANHLLVGPSTHSDLIVLGGRRSPKRGGWIRIQGARAEIFPVYGPALPALHEWAEDQGLVLYAGNDNVIKKIPDLQQDNNYNPNPKQDTNQFFGPNDDEPVEDHSGVHQCPTCDRIFPSWDAYQFHRKQPHDEEPRQDGQFPELDMDEASPFEPHFTPQQPETYVVATVVRPETIHEARRINRALDEEEGEFYVAYRHGSPVAYAQLREGSLVDTHFVTDRGVNDLLLSNQIYATIRRYTEQSPKDLVEAPIPFIYDVREDKIHVGHPGMRNGEMEGSYTPGGIVEGVYEPGGKIIIGTVTNMPFTVRHMLELWYNTHPHLEVKSVHMKDNKGSDTKLACASKVQGMVASEQAAFEAHWGLRKAGGRVYAVGGAVRDSIMARTPKDIDLMVTGLPAGDVEKALKRLPGHTKLTGKDFGVFRYNHKGSEVEVSLPRREHSTGAGHKDFDTQADHTMRPEDDLYRRDFTANAIAVDLTSGDVIDPFGGADDIGTGVLRTTNAASLSEDPLRVVRALVANARFGFEPDEDTRRQMEIHAKSLKHLSSERIQEELDKLFSADDPARAIRLAHETGVLKHILPEVESTFGYDQRNPHHAHDLGTHLLNVLESMAELTTDKDMRLAALLHDIGKPAAAWWHPEDKRQKYYEYHAERDLYGPDGNVIIKQGQVVGQDHHKVGAEMARHRMTELKYPTARIERVSEIIRWHMYGNFSSRKAARRFLNKVGSHADDLLTFRTADRDGKGVDQGHLTPVQTQRKLIDQVRNQREATDTSGLAINGHDLIEEGFEEGPKLGSILAKLTEDVIDDPKLNTREELFIRAAEYRSYGLGYE